MPPELGTTVQEGGGWGVKPTQSRQALDPDVLDAQQRCREVAAIDWIRIVDWGTSTSQLNTTQRKIATDIAQLAANKWNRELSAKRARDGREILRIEIPGGALDEDPVEDA